MDGATESKFWEEQEYGHLMDEYERLSGKEVPRPMPRIKELRAMVQELT